MTEKKTTKQENKRGYPANTRPTNVFWQDYAHNDTFQQGRPADERTDERMKPLIAPSRLQAIQNV